MEDLFNQGTKDLTDFELVSPLFSRPLGLTWVRDVERDLGQIEELPQGVVSRNIKEQVQIVNGRKHIKKFITTTFNDGRTETNVDEHYE